MSYFPFQPDPIDGVEFMPVRIDIHKGVVRIADEEIHHDFEINNTACVVVGRERGEVLASLQEGFPRQQKEMESSRRRTSQRWHMRQGRHGNESRGFW